MSANPFDLLRDELLAELRTIIREELAQLAAPRTDERETGDARWAAGILGKSLHWLRHHMHEVPHSRPPGSRPVFKRADLIAFREARYREGQANTLQAHATKAMRRPIRRTA